MYKKFSHILQVALICAVILTYAPHAHAIPVIDVGNIAQNVIQAIETTISAIQDVASLAIEIYMKLKEIVLDPVSWVYSKMQINAESNDILQQVRGGVARPETGSPLFVTDWTKVGTVAMQNEKRFFMDELNASNKIDPAYKDTVYSALNSNSNRSVFNRLRPTFARDTGCSAPDNPDGSSPCLGNFLGDFSQGGWQGWNSVISGEGNNPYLSILSLQGEQYNRQAQAAQSRRDEAMSSGGVLGTQTCKRVYSAEGDGSSYVTRCTITTPGTTVSENVSKVFGSPIDTLQEVDELSEVLAGAFQSLIGNLRDQGLAPSENPDEPDVVDQSRDALAEERRRAAQDTLTTLSETVNKTLLDLDDIFRIKQASYSKQLALVAKINEILANAQGGGSCEHHPEVWGGLDYELQNANALLSKLQQQVQGTPGNPGTPGNYQVGGYYTETLTAALADITYLKDVIDSNGDTEPAASAGVSASVLAIFAPHTPAYSSKDRERLAEQLTNTRYSDISGMITEIGNTAVAQTELDGINTKYNNLVNLYNTCYDHAH